MMSVRMNSAIEAKNLGKRYFLGRKARPWLGSGRGRILFGRVRPHHEFWALRDLNFVIEKGEAVGIVGPNGAGKTTLLKLLGNVTKPTTGNIFLQGRVGALIELGAGFHTELTGRENIYLYGSILGMKRREISAKFDRIVAFAELDEFMDTPVKRYSAGMYVRLAFAIAAHVDPDILVVDEVLAVGDLHFQKKCFDWIQSFVKSGKTLLLVSHQLNQIENVCQRALFIKGGRLIVDGTPDIAISRFLSDGESRGVDATASRIGLNKELAGEVDVVDVNLYSSGDRAVETVIQDQPLTVKIHVQTMTRITRPKIEIAFVCDGITVGQANTISDNAAPEFIEGEGIVTFHWPRCFLSPNSYSIDIYISDASTTADLCVWHHALDFRVLLPGGRYLGSGTPGSVKIPGTWSFESK